MMKRCVWLLAAAVVVVNAAVGRGQLMPLAPAPAGGVLLTVPSTAPSHAMEADRSVPGPRAALRGKEVYASAFEKGATEHWSKAQIAKCPSGRRTFLGPFSFENTMLTLDNLPEHARVRLSFDLLVILSWDGDLDLDQPTATGPDLFDVTVDRGPRLLHASFAWPNADRHTQSFPGRFPYDHLPAATGAVEIGSLGYVWPGGESGPWDWVYHVERSFAHGGKQLKIAFSGINLQGVADEAWGLDSVRVEVLPPREPHKIEDAAFTHWWTDLGSADPKKFVPAIDGMIDLGESGAAAIRRQLAPPTSDGAQERRIRTLISRLDANNFMAREKATAELRNLGRTAEPALRAAREETMSLEVRVRIDKLLSGLKWDESETDRRLRRAAEVLELIGGEQARAGLSDIARGSGALAAWEAKAAIQRMDGQAEIPTKLDLPPGLAKSAPAAPPQPALPSRILLVPQAR